MIGRLILGLVLTLGVAAPAFASWDSFEIIQWQPRDVEQLKTLRGLGVTGVMVMANRDGTGTPVEQQTQAPRATGLRWYIENIGTDFYSPYHKYSKGRPENWRFLEARERYRANPDNRTALFRDPPLLDSIWRERIRARLTETVQQQKSNRPLFYSLGDEVGIADLSAYWDFDLSPVSITGFRTWLRGQYGSLAALNAEWATSYTAWESIQPETTQTALRRTDDNCAAWNDFKAWMDTSFADALRFGTDTIHRADPSALSAIEGAQTSGWGGYDYTKLAHAVDVMEIYDDGINLRLLRSLNPGLIPLTTSFAATAEEIHRIWRGVLLGVRGLVVWDDDHGVVRDDASIGPRGQQYAPLFEALRGDVVRRIIDAKSIHDSVAVLYSPVSFRVRWMLDHRHEGDAWMHRAADMEIGETAWRIALRDYVAALGRLGLNPRFITPEQLANGPPAETTLILPHAIALSPAERNAIKAFAARGGQVMADTPPGQFDGHARRVAAPMDVPIVPPGDLGRVIRVKPAFNVKSSDNDVDTYVYQARGHRLLALQRRTPGGQPANVTIELKGQRARDVTTGRDYGRNDRLALTLGPIAPVLLEIEP